MKRIQSLTFTLLLAFALYLPIKTATAQLTATLEGHTDNVWSVAFSPNGKMLASASWDETVRLWSVDTEQLLHTLTGHTNDIMSVAFSPDGSTLASASWDSTIRLWDPRTGKLKRTLTEHAGGVASIVFSPDGETLASGSADQTIRLWNAKTWKLEKTLRGHTNVVETVAFSPDGVTLASGGRDTTIRLWDPNNGRHKRTLTEHTAPVSALAFTPDGETLASGSRDRTIRLWNPNNGQEKETLTGYTDGVNPVAFSPDGATLLVGGRGISVWDTETGRYKKPLAGDIGGAISVVFSPDGQMVTSGSADNKVRLWEFNPADYEIPSITTNGMVRLVYFLPNDRPTRPERVTALRQLIRDAQQFFADQMESHGYGRKTFTFETDKDGEPVVHRIDAKFNENYYNKHDKKTPDETIWEEIVEHFDDFQHIYFIVMDVSNEVVGKDACGIGAPTYFSFNSSRFASVDGLAIRHRDITQGDEVLGGMCFIPASGPCFEDNRGFQHRLRVTTHELGHTFGLEHEFRESADWDNEFVMGGGGFQLSKCAAEWLSVSRFFNTKPLSANTPGEIKLLSIQAYSQDTTNLRFKVTDPDELHQAQLLVPTIWNGTGWGAYRLFDCQRLNGKTHIIESPVRTAEIVDRVTLQIMDVNGNITWATFPIELDEVVSARNALDVDSDGTVNISDLTPIASRYGQRESNPADVNKDKVVDIVDVLLVVADLSAVPRKAPDTFTSADVQKWLRDAEQLGIENEYLLKGKVFLERLLMRLEQDPLLTLDPNKITGPWLWMIAPTKTGRGGAQSNNVDSLADSSGGSITEADVAATGAKEGDAVGTYVWTLGKITETGGDNVNVLINNIGMAEGKIDDHSSYALITLESATAQSDVTMRAGSDDSIKIWLNSEVVHNNPIDRGASDFQDTFKVNLNKGDNLLLVKVSERDGDWSMFVGIDADVNAIYKLPSDPVASADVNNDGAINVLDLVLISINFGKTGQNPADVNGDGVVNIVDLVKVAGEIGAGAAAPAAHPQTEKILTAADVRHWLTQAQHANLTDATSQRGILMLQELLSTLIPKETSLLPNYPNPFNPETWIPYQLAQTAEVTLTIYAADGRVVRTLSLGYQRAGIYHSKNRAAYWDGRNAVGEPIASGVYFYTLEAGDFTATRKMLIRK